MVLAKEKSFDSGKNKSFRPALVGLRNRLMGLRRYNVRESTSVCLLVLAHRQYTAHAYTTEAKQYVVILVCPHTVRLN